MTKARKEWQSFVTFIGPNSHIVIVESFIFSQYKYDMYFHTWTKVFIIVGGCPPLAQERTITSISYYKLLFREKACITDEFRPVLRNIYRFRKK